MNQSTGDGLHVPPRGTAVRGNSGYAPESISGNVERVPTTSHRQGRGDGYDEYSSADERKGGTFSRMFKRKPVSGAEAGTTGTTGEEKKRFF